MDIILTDNGKQFVYYPFRSSKDKNKIKSKKKSEFTQICEANGIEHRQTLVYHPWTNGQVERINRTIKDATVKKYYYDNHEKLQKHLDAFINAYNYAQPLKVLKGKTPYEKVLLYLNSEKGKSKINPMYKSLGPNIFIL